MAVKPGPLQALMRGSSVRTDQRCAVCGKLAALRPIRIAPPHAAPVVWHGFRLRSPTITLCPACALRKETGRLHFRWVDRAAGHDWLDTSIPSVSGGHWEAVRTEERMSQTRALGLEGWFAVPVGHKKRKEKQVDRYVGRDREGR